MQNNLYKRISRIETMADACKAEQTESLTKAYYAACEQHNEDDAADFARKIRNRLLDHSDTQMFLDRFWTGITDSEQILTLLTSFFTGHWAQYRQQLRDLPEQEGFPFNIDWPIIPDQQK